MNNLCPCPFCGGRRLEMARWHVCGVECLDCEASGPAAEDEPSATRLWNTRASSDQVVRDWLASTAAELSDVAEALRESARDG